MDTGSQMLSHRSEDQQAVHQSRARDAQLPHRTPHAALELQIGELVLDGFDGIDGVQLGAIVQQELARLLAEGEMPTTLLHRGAIPRLDGGAITVQPGVNMEVLGAQIARAVYGGLGT